MPLDLSYIDRVPDPQYKNERMYYGRETHGLHPALIAAPIVANGLDAYSTQQGLKRGGREVNPLIEPLAGNPKAFYPVKALIGAATGFGGDKISKMGHPNLAKVIVGFGTALPLAAAIHNMRQK